MTLEEVTTLNEAIKRLKEVIKEVRSTIQPFLYDNEAKDYILKALEQPKWIPVSERLPEDNELVLFSTKTDRVFEGRFFSDNTYRQWYSFRDETFAWNNVVIAWMPLPKSFEPKESEEEA